MYAVVVVLLLLTADDACSLKLRDFNVPAVVMRGEPVWLNCSYDLEHDKLYSIKWHKNNVEFYRYLPADNPPGQKYELAGIHLELSRSKEGNIFLSRTDVNSEGAYRCEVSTEDLFQTVRGEKEMKIYVNPTSPPQIWGTKQQYLSGETVNASCISAPSRPAAILKWWINNIEAKSDYLIGPKVEENFEGLIISTLVLSFKVKSSHFWNGRMNLICEAIISQGHKLRSGEILISNKSSLRTMYINYDSQKDAPTITGGKNRYNVGDNVDIKCTSSKSHPAAELHWYINDKEAKSDYVKNQSPIYYKDGMVSTVLGLQFEVKHRHFQNGEMRLRCTATLSDVMRMASDPLEAEISERQMSDLQLWGGAETLSSDCLRMSKIHNVLCTVLFYTVVIGLIL